MWSRIGLGFRLLDLTNVSKTAAEEEANAKEEKDDSYRKTGADFVERESKEEEKATLSEVQAEKTPKRAAR